MQSLIVRQTPKRGRVLLTLGASLLLHGGIIGIAALWDAPQPADHSVEIVITDGPREGPNPLPPTADTPTTEASPTPPLDEPPAPTVPTMEKDPEFAEASPTPPPQKPSVARQVTPRVARPSTASGPTSNRSNNLMPGSSAPGGNGTGPVADVKSWVMPHPSYPRLPAGFRPTGSTTVRIVTDASGQVSSVVIVKSAGNPVLDSQTQSYVRMNWHGPPNASRTTEFVYQVR